MHPCISLRKSIDPSICQSTNLSVNVNENPCFLANQSKSRTISFSHVIKESFQHEEASLALWALLASWARLKNINRPAIRLVLGPSSNLINIMFIWGKVNSLSNESPLYTLRMSLKKNPKSIGNTPS